MTLLLFQTYSTVTMEQTPVLILGPYRLFLLLSPSEDRAKDKGNNSIGSRLNRMEDKVGFVQLQWKNGGNIPPPFFCLRSFVSFVKEQSQKNVRGRVRLVFETQKNVAENVTSPHREDVDNAVAVSLITQKLFWNRFG